MAEGPWLTIIGYGEDGPAGLPPASVKALAAAEIIIGAARHIDLLGPVDAETRVWPVPFADGLPQLDALRGTRVVVLASGDPFWFGAGSVIAKRYDASEWRAIPAPSVFSLAAARLGWPLETTRCMGLHAAPLARLRPHLAPGARILVTLRDGDAVSDLARYLTETGFGSSDLCVLEALGGPRETITHTTADAMPDQQFGHPVCAAITVAGNGAVLSAASGQMDELFDNDGQITKRPVRTLTLSALAPTTGALLWDIGGGSGSIAIEWLLSDPTTQAVCIEPRGDRAARIVGNAARLGVDRLNVVTGKAPEVLPGLPLPQVVFIGGGLSDLLLSTLTELLPSGTRIVANAVTLESESTLAQWQAKLGGTLMRIELSHAKPLGARLGWQTTYPIVQWSVTL